MHQLDELAKEWLEWKRREDHSREQRVATEEKILQLAPAKEEGSATVTTDAGLKIKTTGKISYRVDLDLLQVLTSDWPADARPIKAKLEADESKLRAIRQHSPKIWASIAQAVETKPAKTGVSIEVPEK